MSDIETFESLRPLLFSIAYRMLGSVMDAEDIIQEAYLHWHRRGDEEIASPRAFPFDNRHAPGDQSSKFGARPPRNLSRTVAPGTGARRNRA